MTHKSTPRPDGLYTVHTTPGALIHPEASERAHEPSSRACEMLGGEFVWVGPTRYGTRAEREAQTRADVAQRRADLTSASASARETVQALKDPPRVL